MVSPAVLLSLSSKAGKSHDVVIYTMTLAVIMDRTVIMDIGVIMSKTVNTGDAVIRGGHNVPGSWTSSFSRSPQLQLQTIIYHLPHDLHLKLPTHLQSSPRF